jgi:hypothetical protein
VKRRPLQARRVHYGLRVGDDGRVMGIGTGHVDGAMVDIGFAVGGHPVVLEQAHHHGFAIGVHLAVDGVLGAHKQLLEHESIFGLGAKIGGDGFFGVCVRKKAHIPIGKPIVGLDDEFLGQGLGENVLHRMDPARCAQSNLGVVGAQVVLEAALVAKAADDLAGVPIEAQSLHQLTAGGERLLEVGHHTDHIVLGLDGMGHLRGRHQVQVKMVEGDIGAQLGEVLSFVELGAAVDVDADGLEAVARLGDANEFPGIFMLGIDDDVGTLHWGRSSWCGPTLF